MSFFKGSSGTTVTDAELAYRTEQLQKAAGHASTSARERRWSRKAETSGSAGSVPKQRTGRRGR